MMLINLWRFMRKEPKLKGFTLEQLKARFLYNPESGVFTAREDTHKGRWKAGREVGSRLKSWYVMINVDGTMILAHRLAWFLTYGGDVPKELDHINNNYRDNRIANLRPATRSQNSVNVPRRKHNACGFKGVYFCKTNEKYRAQIKIKGKTKHLGYFIEPQDAANAYYSAATAEHNHYAKGDYAAS